MHPKRKKRSYSIGELVSAAYKQASYVTTDRQVASVVATKLLESWLSQSDHPELVDRLQSAC